ncbi:MAG: DUF4337 domain-containing protein [Hyphomicrobiaceae bacterium]
MAVLDDSSATSGREDGKSKVREKWIGVYIGLLAVVLAVCAMGGGNAQKDAARANLDATNTWAFFQAKNARRTMFQVAADDLELQLKANPATPADARAAIEKKIAEYRRLISIYTSDKQRNEGLDELWEKAKSLEKERDLAAARDPYFDWAQALLQIAIVIASIALITGGNPMLLLSIGLGLLGSLLTLNGFTLVVRLPFFS